MNELIEKYQQTKDENLLTMLLKLNRGLVFYVVSKYRFLLPRYEFIDLKQELLMELHVAINTFNSAKKTKFATYAYVMMRNRILSMVRRERAKKRDMGNYFYMESYLKQDTLTYHHVMHDENSVLYECIKKEEAGLLALFLSTTLKISEQWLYNAYLHGKSVRIIAGDLEISEASCRNKLTYIKRKIRNNSKNYKSD